MRDLRSEAARRFAEVHGPEPDHARQVVKTSLALFDALADLHGLGDTERVLLEAAAWLHDTGYSNRPMQHHKGSRDLILASDFEGFSRRELAVVACVARYHRKTMPDKSHSVYADLDAADQAVVGKLAAILRVADGLDRSHAASAKLLTVKQERGVVRIRVKQRAPNPVDIETAMRKGDLFEQTFGVTLEVTGERESRKASP